MKNSTEGTAIQGNAPKSKKSNSKKSDSINLENIKVDLKNADKSVPLNKESIQSSKSIYSKTEGMKEEEKKKFRSKIRRALHSYCNQILGKDRSEEERKTAIKSFLSFYKENWKIQDFKMENFTQSKDADDLADYRNLLKFVSSSLAK